MNYLVLAAITCLASELFLRLPMVPAARRVLAASREVVGIIREPALDDRVKEQQLLRMARTLAIGSLRLAGWMAVVAIAIIGSAVFADALLPGELDLLESSTTPSGMVLITSVSLFYLAMRVRQRAG